MVVSSCRTLSAVLLCSWCVMVSSRKCSDLADACPSWAAAGECEANPDYMHSHCSFSCNTCEKQQHSCEDIGDDAHADGDLAAAFQRMLSREELGPRLLSNDPWVLLLETFVTEEEAVDIVRVGGHNFSRSLAGFADGYVASRTSSTSWCNVQKCEDDHVMVSLKAKITSLLGCPPKNTEHLQVLRYEPGQFYKTHHDQNSPVDSATGPRVFTFFLYLSNVTKGGETHFPQLKLKVTPKAGTALVWTSVRDDDVYREEPRTEHEAMPVVEGIKYAANFWTHLRDFQTPHAAGCGTRAIDTAKARRLARNARSREHIPKSEKDEL